MRGSGTTIYCTDSLIRTQLFFIIRKKKKF